MDKGGAAIHLDPPNHPLYPPNISWISTIFIFPTYSCLQCISKCALFILYYFYASEDSHCASIRRRGPGMLMAWYMTIILAFGEDALASREDIWHGRSIIRD